MARKSIPPSKRKKPQKAAGPRSAKRPAKVAVVPEPVSVVESGPEDAAQDAPLFPIVGIGASAGGLQAFSEFISHLPPNLNMAFVYIQHLDPNHVSSLAQVLRRQTTMPIHQAEMDMLVEPNTIYIIPPNVTMCLKQGRLDLMPRPERPRPSMPVDSFFRSLAEEKGSRAIGIVLSGAASDGTLGLKAIKAADGITFAQDPASAEYDGMPRSAIAAGCGDFIRQPSYIAEELTRISRHPYISPEVARLDELLMDSEASVSSILAMLRNATGVDFTHYKSSTIKRRILRRMALNRVEGGERYVAYLRSHPPELRALYDDILINVTEFFRDGDLFDALKTNIFPRIAPEGEPPKSLRFWIPGCATGEEVYSVAICLLEYLDDRIEDTQIQIFATDISDRTLDTARAGIYPDNIAQDVSPERLRRFFTKLESGYQIQKRIREMCLFAKQNLAKDPPFSKVDLISCRNVLIYMGPVLQRRIMPFFHYALKPDGYLVLGSSETIGSFNELFTLVDRKNKIYVRKIAATRVPLDLALRETVLPKSELPERVPEWREPELTREVDRLVLSRFGPDGLVVDDDMNILQFRGHTGMFVEPASGTASFNLMKMAREGLLVELRSAIQKVRRTNATVRREGLHVGRDGSLKEFDLEVLPLKRPPGKDRRFLVLFENPAKVANKPLRHAAAKRDTLGLAELESLNEQLRRDLDATKEYLQSIIEEQEASNEELRSANEEIQSSNEELQSTNEELETAKEELQSANEELNTVNEELQTRNMQLSQAGNDLLNLLSNVSIPIVMLGNDLRIRRFTPISEKILNLIPTDVGRPINDIKFNLDVPDLESILLDVLENLTPQTREVRDKSGRVYSLRVRPYRTEDYKIDGLVLVLVDMDMARTVASDSDAELAAGGDQILHGRDAGARHTAEQIRAFAGMLLQAQEDERRRVARELHDDLSQKLAAVELDMAKLEPEIVSTRARAAVERLRQAVADLSEDTRRLAHQLHPSVLDDLGLVVAIESFCRQFSEREGIRTNFQHNHLPDHLPADFSLALYRVVQEGLRNVSKHSRAKEVNVSLLSVDSKVHLSIKDNGVGFDATLPPRLPGLGLTAMQERVRLHGGLIVFRSAPGQGTDVFVEMPLEPLAVQSRKE